MLELLAVLLDPLAVGLESLHGWGDPVASLQHLVQRLSLETRGVVEGVQPDRSEAISRGLQPYA